ncbi:(2Fe-2S)-binding protein [Paenibacillus sediminis]|uniref:Ferric iron reductase protein FhuF n=1 Tax=Paenibacillus sediminis TaxID=664909 RepID=A0ABS4H2P5_9BACL|nr:(2Fe-2S)-binding protein [Paenibacillus sediminis]MBP1936746.1 ferric iron reductase protein FhuF [Paenibacillus sediminis]
MDIDYGLLQNYCWVVTEDVENMMLSVPAIQLTDPEKCEQFLTAYKTFIQAEDLSAAATYFVAWFKGISAAQQYLVSFCDRQLDLSLSNLIIQLYPKGRVPWVAFKLIHTAEQPVPGEDHEEWRSRQLDRFYGEELYPLMATFSRVSDTHISQLWGQLPGGLHYFYGVMAAIAGDHEPLRERFESDFQYTIRQINPSLFGLKKNPLNGTNIFIDNPYDPSQPMRMKDACCQAYRTGSGEGYCYSCPRLSNVARNKMKQEIIASLEA